MKTFSLYCTLFLLVICSSSWAQHARIKGIIFDEFQQVVSNAQIVVGNTQTQTDETGYYQISVPAKQKIRLRITHVSYKPLEATFELRPNEDFEFHPILKMDAEQLSEVVINSRSRERIEGITQLQPEMVRRIPSASSGVEGLLKSLPGVNSNNELSSSYAVRGGNYDENLVYVNEIEVYRPFLIRSGQQEGLSFTNTDLISKVDFSAGGFQAKYGDKLSSVLDITYRTPKKFAATMEASFLGGAASFDVVSKDQRWSAVTGVRYRDNSLLVNSQETETNYRPRFMDAQTLINFNASTKWSWSFLGNMSSNKYSYQPLSRQTNFGTADNPIALVVNYKGQEEDEYETYMGAIKGAYKLSETTTLKAIASIYHTKEQEHFDIHAAYFLGEIDSNLGSETLGDVRYTRGIGEQINHARNNLDALIANAELKGFHDFKDTKSTLEWGVKFTREDIRDRLVEWEVIDSTGFFINPPRVDLPRNDQPYNPYVGPLVPYQYIRATNETQINRFSGFAQYNKSLFVGAHEMWVSAGVRAHQWAVDDKKNGTANHLVMSPRAQVSFKPAWEKDMVFRLSGGLYYQPPMYRELRNFDGVVVPDVKAQKSIHYVLGGDYSFLIWERDFKLTAEAYYKDLSDVNTYTLDNVRIRYRADNNATAYVQGFDIRLNGEFVPGTESWFSFGYLKTEENYNDQGDIARPTDQRLKFAATFQDYMPNLPNVKVYLNVNYNSGLPGGSPSYANPYDYQTRLRDYKRADVGFMYVFTENNDFRPEGHWLKNFKDLSLGFEIFNLFNNQNAITNTWVRDVYTKTQYGIPNYMTTRVFNLKLTAKL